MHGGYGQSTNRGRFFSPPSSRLYLPLLLLTFLLAALINTAAHASGHTDSTDSLSTEQSQDHENNLTSNQTTTINIEYPKSVTPEDLSRNQKDAKQSHRFEWVYFSIIVFVVFVLGIPLWLAIEPTKFKLYFKPMNYDLTLNLGSLLSRILIIILAIIFLSIIIYFILDSFSRDRGNFVYWFQLLCMVIAAAIAIGSLHKLNENNEIHLNLEIDHLLTSYYTAAINAHVQCSAHKSSYCPKCGSSAVKTKAENDTNEQLSAEESTEQDKINQSAVQSSTSTDPAEDCPDQKIYQLIYQLHLLYFFRTWHRRKRAGQDGFSLIEKAYLDFLNKSDPRFEQTWSRLGFKTIYASQQLFINDIDEILIQKKSR